MLSHPSYKRGFSLIELMIGVAILAILLSAVIPSFKVWIQNAKIRTAAESLKNGLQLARLEAIRRNERVFFSLVGTDSTWSVQTVAASGVPIQSRSSAEGSSNVTLTITPLNSTSATFNGLGQLTANPDGSSAITSMVVGLPTAILSTSEMRTLNIYIGTGGQIRSCDPYFPSSDPRGC
jgi:type IV fimbrial biogenesis protein FimT